MTGWNDLEGLAEQQKQGMAEQAKAMQEEAVILHECFTATAAGEKTFEMLKNMTVNRSPVMLDPRQGAEQIALYFAGREAQNYLVHMLAEMVEMIESGEDVGA